MYTPYKLLDWIDINELKWKFLSENPNAINILEKNLDAVCIEKQSFSIPRPQSHIIDYALHNQLGADKVNWEYLSKNPNAIHLLEAYPDKINWNGLSQNPNAIHLLEQNLVESQRDGSVCKINWYWISSNPNAIHILEKNPDKINWDRLSGNPNAIHLLEKNLDESRRDGSVCKINWFCIAANINAINLIQKNLDKIEWDDLSINQNAIDLLTSNQDKIYWALLSANKNAISLLEKNLDAVCIEKQSFSIPRPQSHIIDYALHNQLGADKIDWGWLSMNPNAIPILKKNLDKVDWYSLSINPNIFTYDYEFIEKRINIFKEELVMKVFHPQNIYKFEDWGY
jgi:hypothetical protein